MKAQVGMIVSKTVNTVHDQESKSTENEISVSDIETSPNNMTQISIHEVKLEIRHTLRLQTFWSSIIHRRNQLSVKSTLDDECLNLVEVAGKFQIRGIVALYPEASSTSVDEWNIDEIESPSKRFKEDKLKQSHTPEDKIGTVSYGMFPNESLSTTSLYVPSPDSTISVELIKTENHSHYISYLTGP
ncbi:7237_t:CDS:2, partial [Acaulospora colombiana]